MLFDIKRRQAEFGVFHNRRENEGEKKAVTKAIDLPVKIQLKAKELDMLVPTNGIPISQFLFGADLRKPELQTHLLSPICVYRKPEHVEVAIFDDGVDKRKVMRFKDCKIKDPYIEFDQTSIFLSFKVQMHPGNLLQRISDNVESQKRDFECKATQPELFDEKGEDDEGKGGTQADPMGSPDEEQDEDDDE
jgi:hypothetical protein